MPAPQIRIVEVSPPLGSVTECALLQPFNLSVTMEIIGSLANTSLTAELWSNIPDANKPQDDWHGLRMTEYENMRQVDDHHFLCGKSSQRKSYLRRTYIVSLLPVRTGRYEVTARVGTEATKWSVDTHSHFSKTFQKTVYATLLAFHRPGTPFHKLSRELLFNIIEMSAPVDHTTPQWRWAGGYRANAVVNVQEGGLRSTLIPRSPRAVPRFVQWVAEGIYDLRYCDRNYSGALACQSNGPDGQAWVSGGEKEHKSRGKTREFVNVVAFTTAIMCAQVYDVLQASTSWQRRQRVSDNYVCRAVGQLVRSLRWTHSTTNCSRILAWAFGSSKKASEIMRSVSAYAPAGLPTFDGCSLLGSEEGHTLWETSKLAFSQLLELAEALLGENVELRPNKDQKGMTEKMHPSEVMVATAGSSSDLVILELVVDAAQQCPSHMVSPSIIQKIVHDLQLAVSHTRKAFLYQVLKSISLREDVPNVRQWIADAALQALLARTAVVRMLNDDENALPCGLHHVEVCNHRCQRPRIDQVLRIWLDVLLTHVDTSDPMVIVRPLIGFIVALREEEDQELSVAVNLLVEAARRKDQIANQALYHLVRCCPVGNSGIDMRVVRLLCRILELSEDADHILVFNGEERTQKTVTNYLCKCMKSTHANVAVTALRACKKLVEWQRLDAQMLAALLSATEEAQDSHWNDAVRTTAAGLKRILKVAYPRALSVEKYASAAIGRGHPIHLTLTASNSIEGQDSSTIVA